MTARPEANRRFAAAQPPDDFVIGHFQRVQMGHVPTEGEKLADFAVDFGQGCAAHVAAAGKEPFRVQRGQPAQAADRPEHLKLG